MQGFFPLTVRAANGQDVPVTRGQDVSIYSSALVASAQSANLEFFSYSLGENVIGVSGTQADERHTNIDFSKTMPNNRWMDVISIGFELPLDTTVTVAKQLLEQLYFEFKTAGAAPVYTGVARHFPAGNGIGLATTNNATEVVSNGAIDSPRFNFATPMRLFPGKQFRATGLIKGTLTMACATQHCRLVYRGWGENPV